MEIPWENVRLSQSEFKKEEAQGRAAESGVRLPCV
jgi:hypothetical protein